MKYLKYFESNESDYYNGLTKESIEDMFIDISDMSFEVRASLTERTVVLNPISHKRSGIRMQLGDIPYIEVRITTIWQQNMDYLTQLDDSNRRLIDLYKNPELQEVMKEVDERVNEHGWYVSELMIDPPVEKIGSHRKVIKIFLHRQKDKKYVAPSLSVWDKNK